MSSAILPFLVIPDELVGLSPWHVELSTGEDFEDPDFVENWDNQTSLAISRRLTLDKAAALEAIGLAGSTTSLELVVWVGAGDGRLPTWKKVLFRQEIEASGSGIDILLEMPGEGLADAVHIDCILMLGNVDPGSGTSLAPKNRGDILWRERSRVRLEGDISRFPVSETDLGAFLGSDWRDTLWYLEVSWDDMMAPFNSSVRLHINSSKGDFVRRFRDGDAGILQPVLSDVMVQIASGFLENADYMVAANAKEEPESLAAIAMQWLEQAFASVENARHLRSIAPGRFHAQLNALAAVEGGAE